MKNIDKIYERTIMTYVFLLIITMIIKLLGGNFFALALNNEGLLLLNNLITSVHLENIWYAISIYIYSIFIISMTVNKNNKALKKYCLIILPIFISIQLIKNNNLVFLIIGFSTLLVASIIYILFINKEKLNIKETIKQYLFVVLINVVIQLISVITRNGKIELIGNNFIANFIYNLDYFLLMLIIYKYYFMKGCESVCSMVASFSSHLLQELKSLPKRLRDYFIRNSRLSNEGKVEKAVYIPLIILFNLFTLSCILFIAVLNGAFIEAIYITISFWINKTAFGKPYHAETVAKCFIISSLSYFCLTRITTEIGISIFIPVVLGIALSYVTSLLVKDKYERKLYKGMPVEDLYKIVGLVTNNELEKKMLKEYYCDRMTQTAVAMRNNYSISSFEKKKKKILDRLKEV